MQSHQPQTGDPVALARLIRHGQLKLEDVPEADRPLVDRIARSLTDAQLILLEPRVRHVGRMGRSFVKERKALS
jgi:hypothetical protein